jgi:hypothetical protein
MIRVLVSVNKSCWNITRARTYLENVPRIPNSGPIGIRNPEGNSRYVLHNLALLSNGSDRAIQLVRGRDKKIDGLYVSCHVKIYTKLGQLFDSPGVMCMNDQAS